MAWSWSHTQEAYASARRNLDRLPSEDVRIIWSEWQARIVEDTDAEDGFDPLKYDKALKQSKKIADDVLRDIIWENAETLALCDNGGHTAWVCPWGCHTVSFSDDEE